MGLCWPVWLCAIRKEEDKAIVFVQWFSFGFVLFFPQCLATRGQGLTSLSRFSLLSVLSKAPIYRGTCNSLFVFF